MRLENYLTEKKNTRFKGATMFILDSNVMTTIKNIQKEWEIEGLEIQIRLEDFNIDGMMDKKTAEHFKRMMGAGVKLDRFDDTYAEYLVDLKKASLDKIDRFLNSKAYDEWDDFIHWEVFVYVKLPKGFHKKDFENKYNAEWMYK